MPKQSGNEVSGSAPHRGSEISIVYIDDNPHDQFFVEEATRSCRLDMTFQFLNTLPAARTYLEGAGQLCNRGLFPMPAAVLLDFFIGIENSLELLRWIRGRPEFVQTPVIIYSDSDAEGHITACYKAGADHFVAKAASFERLTVLVGLLYQSLAAAPADFKALRRIPEYRLAPRASGLSALVCGIICAQQATF
ncbi:MAG: hypothetical protein C5B50_19005 [Verrucomicrobia bacterium]|nr:MAG: hypothetical protein C5B50_19005 [Verrucomicrobiota bacterium]